MLSRPTGAEWRASLTRTYGEAKANALIAAMKKAHPEKSIRTLSYGVSALNNRNNVTRRATMKQAQKGAPIAEATVRLSSVTGDYLISVRSRGLNATCSRQGCRDHDRLTCGRQMRHRI